MTDGDDFEARIGDGEFRLVFTGPPTAEHIGAQVEGPFLTVGDSIVLDDALLDYLANLDRSWQGWAGVKSWTSVSDNLTLNARHDGIGRIFITAAFRSPGLADGEGSEGAWTASAVVVTEPSALGHLATKLRAIREAESV